MTTIALFIFSVFAVVLAAMAFVIVGAVGIAIAETLYESFWVRLVAGVVCVFVVADTLHFFIKGW